MKKYFLLLAFNILIVISGFTQIQNPVTWKYSVVQVSDGNYLLKFTAKIQPHWHIYNQSVNDEGPVPTSFQFEKNPNYKKDGMVKELSKGEVLYDSSFMLKLRIFSNEAVFEQKIIPKTKTPFTIKGTLTYMCCNNRQCLAPKNVDFSFNIPATKSVIESKPDVPKVAVIDSGINDQKKVTSDTSTVKTIVNSKPVQGTGKPEDNGSLWSFFLIAFITGLAGIFTPCVYPMIPMTVSFFMRDEKKRSAGMLKGIMFGISIIFIYTMIGVVVAITKSGVGITNFISTHWLPNLIFFGLFVVFAISFFGAFEIVLPGSLANKIDKQVDKGGYAAPFFMALTLVIVSFSCTAPFVGTILVEASQGIVTKPIIGMFGYSLAFAIPFMIFAISPALLKKLSKSGAWLNSVKVVMAFVLLAFSLKFLLTIDSTHHFNILTREVYLSIWIVIFTMLGFYLLGKIKFSNDGDVPHLGVSRLLLVIITFSFVVYLVPGLFGAPLNALSSMLPPQSKEGFFRSGKTDSDSNKPLNLCEQPKYADILEFPSGMNGYFDYQQGVACAQKLNKPILLDFKGHACSNCKKMEGGVFTDQEILEKLRNDFVIIALYTDDAFKLPESEWIKSSYDGEMKKSMGDKNLDFGITKFRSNTQPLYSIINSKGDTLGKPIEFTMNVQAFKAFLDAGKARFANKK
jgi:thiol:disulfide interchange protein